MILVPKGPQIPPALQKALIQNKLVLFCGAGISCQNGLPLFPDLVKELCKKLHLDINEKPLLKSADKREDYAGILDLLEGNQEFSVKPEVLREEVIKILESFKKEPQIHKDLLDLSALSEGKGHRLVTTNFDRLFFEARLGLDPNRVDQAPKLAPPREGEWNHLTFLHGVIDKENDPKGKNLTLTRSDFGRAYLYDAWATRFIIQLFQNFTVLFVGYSVNDPVMTYLVSAISAEKKERRDNQQDSASIRKEEYNTPHPSPSIYAFAGYREGEQKDEEDKWISLGIEPLTYKINMKADNKEDHSLLYESIKQWADLKKSGLTGRKRFLKNKLKTPFREDTDKEEAETVISFLETDKELAEYFPKIDLPLGFETRSLAKQGKNNASRAEKSNLDYDKKSRPVDISWLKAFAKKKENPKNYKTPPGSSQDEQSENILIKLTRPSLGSLWEPLSHFEKNIALWLCRHLDKKQLIHQLIETGTSSDGLICLHPEFKSRIEWKLESTKLDQREELFWQILTIQKNSPINFLDNYFPTDKLNESYSFPQIKKWLNSLEPQIGFEKAFHAYDKKSGEIAGPDKIYTAKLTIQNQSDNIITNEEILLRHAEDFTHLLKKAIELAQYAGIKEHVFLFQRPSIAPHNQNKSFYPWTCLIDLARDSFDTAIQKNKKLAQVLLEKWKHYPYSLFYRLILYAVTKHKTSDETTALELLANNEDSVLWSLECQNELLRYLACKGRHSKQAVEQLASLIMKGPPRSLYKKDIDEKDFIKSKERYVYKRLNSLKIAGAPLPKDAETYRNQIQSKYKTPKETDDSDNFPIYQYGWSTLTPEKRYHNMPVEEIVDEIKHKPPRTFQPKRGTKFSFLDIKEEFQSLSVDMPEKAWEVLLKFESKYKTNAPAFCWKGFFYGISPLIKALREISPRFENGKIVANNEESSQTDDSKKKHIEKRHKLVVMAFEKAESFSDNFLKSDGLLSAVVHAFWETGGLFFKDEEYFKKWWLRLWNLSLETCDPLNEKDDCSFDAFNSNTGRLTEVVFRILWSAFEKNIPKEGKIPPHIKDYFSIILENEDKKRVPFAQNEKDSSPPHRKGASHRPEIEIPPSQNEKDNFLSLPNQNTFSKTGKGISKNPSFLFHFGSYLSQLWHLDREWTIKNLKPLMEWSEKEKAPPQNGRADLRAVNVKQIEQEKTTSHKNNKDVSQPHLNPILKDTVKHSKNSEYVKKAIWQGYLSHYKSLNPDFLTDFKKEFFDLIMNYKSILSNTDPYYSQYLSQIAHVFFSSTGGVEIKNIFSKEESRELASHTDKELLEALAEGILELFRDSEKDKTHYLWSEKIKAWMEKLWPKQKNKNSHKIAEKLSLIILHCGKSLPSAFDFLKDKIKDEIQQNNHYLIRYIYRQGGLRKNDDINHDKNPSITTVDKGVKKETISTHEDKSPSITTSGKENKKDESDLDWRNQGNSAKNKIQDIFDHPKQLLEILSWNLPESKILYDTGKIKKILEKLKKLHPEIEKNDLFKNLKEKLDP